MKEIENRLQDRLNFLKEIGSYRSLKRNGGLVDFSSNDYLGFTKNSELKYRIDERYRFVNQTGASGSRLLSGHHFLFEEAESLLNQYFVSESSLIFNSGYDANLSLLRSVPQKGDLVVFDQLVHASIHDGIRSGKADYKSFKHNDLDNLESILEAGRVQFGQIFVVIESLYSMDGDLAPIAEIAGLCERYSAALVVDEAHATGVFCTGGLVNFLRLEKKVFARVHTFGKSIGGHGAAVLGSVILREYMINYARPLIFSTALPLHSIVHLIEALKLLHEKGFHFREELSRVISVYLREISKLENYYTIIDSKTAIQGIIIPGNQEVMHVSQMLYENGFDVRGIRFPTVEKGTERLRVCLHSFNGEDEIKKLVQLLLKSKK